MSFNYNRTIRNSASYSNVNSATHTSNSSSAWDDARDAVESYEDQESNFWSNDCDDNFFDNDVEDIDDCVFFN